MLGRNQSRLGTPTRGAFRAVSTGGMHTCGLRADGQTQCWGFNSDGQVLPPDTPFKQVSAGGMHACGLRPDGQLECWGFNAYGQATPPDNTLVHVSAGYLHTCGLRPHGRVVCWGKVFATRTIERRCARNGPTNHTLEQDAFGHYS